MATYNLFVKHLDGQTLTLKLPSPTITGASLKSHLHALTQIPPHHQRLLTGTRQIHDETTLLLPHDTVHLLLRLLGGKGGFGSLLRGAATKAGQKKTNNFDACRDMSGRRLRHVNAEKKLEEWKVEAEQRRLEKVAEEFVKKRVKEGKKQGNGEEQKYIDKYREDSRKCREEVEAAVRESIGGIASSKRKVLGSAGSESKRLKLWMGKEKAEESDSDDEEDEDDDSPVVLDDVNSKIRRKDGEGSSQSVLELPTSEGESSGGGSIQSNLEEETGNGSSENIEVGEGSGSGKEYTEANGLDELKVATYEQIGCEAESACVKESVIDVESGNSKEVVDPSSYNSIPEIREGSEISAKVQEPNGLVSSTVTEMENPSSVKKPLDFDDYNSANELEVLGMETLKAELQSHGLKCGGTLHERAARLFLLKTTPLEKLPKKLLAKK